MRRNKEYYRTLLLINLVHFVSFKLGYIEIKKRKVTL